MEIQNKVLIRKIADILCISIRDAEKLIVVLASAIENEDTRGV